MELPNDLWRAVFARLSFKILLRIELVCKLWKVLCWDQRWRLDLRNFQSEFGTPLTDHYFYRVLLKTGHKLQSINFGAAHLSTYSLYNMKRLSHLTSLKIDTSDDRFAFKFAVNLLDHFTTQLRVFHLDSVDINSEIVMDILTRATNLIDLSWQGQYSQNILKLNKLTQLKKLKGFSNSYYSYFNVSPGLFAPLTNLVSLNTGELIMAFNWGSIASLQKLKKLQVSINYADPSIFVEAVSHLTALHTLDIWDCKRVHFSPIYGWNWENWIHLTNLRELNLHSAHHLHHESLMDMAVLSNLAALEVTGIRCSIGNVPWAQYMTSLRSLKLEFTSKFNSCGPYLSPISQLTRLELYMPCYLKAYVARAISDATQLRTLKLFGKYSRPAALMELTRLTGLEHFTFTAPQQLWGLNLLSCLTHLKSLAITLNGVPASSDQQMCLDDLHFFTSLVKLAKLKIFTPITSELNSQGLLILSCLTSLNLLRLTLDIGSTLDKEVVAQLTTALPDLQIITL